MSIRVYRLLRNNKEEGPFTSEELIQKNLKPFDLIWINGRSAAWNYPSELAEFKTFLPVLPEQTMGNKIQQAAIAVNDNIIQPAKKEKPRFKVSAAWSKIQTITAPAITENDAIEKKAIEKKPMVVQQANFEHSKSLSWQEAWLDWEKEKSTETFVKPEIKSRSGHSSKKNNGGKTVVLETKFAQPLDDLKDKYIDNIVQQKKNDKKNKVSEFTIPALALLVIFSIGYWLLHKSNTTVNLPASTPVKMQPAPTADNAGNTNTINNNNVNVNPVSNNDESKEVSSISSKISNNKSTIPEQAEERIILNTSKKQSTDPSVKTSQKQNTSGIVVNTKSQSTKQLPDASAAKILTGSPSNNADSNANEERTVRRRTDNADNTVVSSTKKDAVVKPPLTAKKTSADYVNVPEYIQMSNGIASINIENVSNDDLDLVVVDVQYYDATNRFRKGETLYLHNLKAGRNITIKTSKDINSSYATSKVALISSDAKQVYVVNDN